MCVAKQWRSPCGVIDVAQSRRHDTPGEDIFDRARRQPSAAQVGDHRAVEFPGLRHRAPPRLERVERRFANRHHPILVALARAHQHHPDFVVDVAPVKADQLAHAQAGGVERLEDRAVAQSGRPAVFAIGFDQPAHVVLGQNRGQAALGARRAQRARRARRAYRLAGVAIVSRQRKNALIANRRRWTVARLSVFIASER